MGRTALFLALASLAALAGCASPELRAERQSCSAKWYREIPPRLVQEQYNQLESRQVPTGQTTCTTNGNVTTCNQDMRTEYYTVLAVRTVDRNKPRRDARINACTRAACLSKYGNVNCEVK